ncbi:MAG: MoxR family ATPase [Lachnospiraceae bacterium]|nr:MoxR family ATPase [Lachnospiraceae bacterium]
MIQDLKNRINRVFVGKEDVVDNVLTCLLAGGHVLLEDVPGIGKTTLAKTLAQALQCRFGRIQFTPDTLPSDVTGLYVYNQKSAEFEYREGPVMNQVLLADEINRTSPKTQASLLEAMAEGQVTVDGVRHPLPDLFFVIATQNPIEYLGTYPLPEAQLDRFMMRLSVGYPSEEAELTMARNFLDRNNPASSENEAPSGVCDASDVVRMRREAAAIHVSDGVLGYIREIIELTRQEKQLSLGASPRALLALVSASQARAYLDGREFVRPDDVRKVAINVLHHRVILSDEARMSGADADTVITTVVRKARIPKEA